MYEKAGSKFGPIRKKMINKPATRYVPDATAGACDGGERSPSTASTQHPVPAAAWLSTFPTVTLLRNVLPAQTCVGETRCLSLDTQFHCGQHVAGANTIALQVNRRKKFSSLLTFHVILCLNVIDGRFTSSHCK